jgi:hypothetical protein
VACGGDKESKTLLALGEDEGGSDCAVEVDKEEEESIWEALLPPPPPPSSAFIFLQAGSEASESSVLPFKSLA